MVSVAVFGAGDTQLLALLVLCEFGLCGSADAAGLHGVAPCDLSKLFGLAFGSSCAVECSRMRRA